MDNFLLKVLYFLRVWLNLFNIRNFKEFWYIVELNIMDINLFSVFMNMYIGSLI